MTMLEPISPPAGFVDRLQVAGLQPGWAKREPAMWPEPRETYVPAIWRYDEALAALTQACDFVSPAFAERRNLIMVNPIPGNSYATCATLVAAYQLVLPGETARSHRHTPNALRFVLDAEAGIYTLVNGARVDLAPGDVVLTPQWHWHGHANYSEAPGFWIDILDVPLVQKLENMFFQHHDEVLETVRSEEPDSPLRLKGAETIPAARRNRTVRIGEAAMPTIALTMERLDAGIETRSTPQIENTILIVAEGEIALTNDTLGRTNLTRGDVCVLPAWHAFSLRGGDGGGTLLRVTDAPVFGHLAFKPPAPADLEPS